MYKNIQDVYGRDRNLTIIQKVLGSSEGEAELMISNASTISSLSQEWINAVKGSGRFSDYEWEENQVVKMTTLNKLIEQYGTPSFIKIDVEGSEYEVIKGLSKPIETISLEFVPEIIEPYINCIHYLQRLGNTSWNYTLGESMKFELEEWIIAEEMVKILTDFRNNAELWGDMYVRFMN